MPLQHTESFRILFDECDPYGHLNHAHYLRYMLETAILASAVAGYGVARYEEMNRVWLVRDTEITYFAPLRYGDEMAITTWALDFRRVRARRVYEARHAKSGELAARALTDWAFLDKQTLRPARVPPEMVDTFLPEGNPSDPPPRQRFPRPPAPPSGIFTQERRVQWSEVDPNGHVNNAVYLTYAEDCAIQDAASRGWSMARMMDEGGFGIVARRFRLAYRRPALFDDRLTISTWVSDVRRATAVRHFKISHANGELLARGRGEWVWIDLATGRPKRIPQQFLDDFAANIAA